MSGLETGALGAIGLLAAAVARAHLWIVFRSGAPLDRGLVIRGVCRPVHTRRHAAPARPAGDDRERAYQRCKGWTAGVSINELEAHYLAGGNVVRVVNALISADKANITMPFRRAAAIDLAGRDVLEAVKMSVIPKVIETASIAAVAKDGIQLVAVSRVTVRTNLDRLVGGAGEETIIARVGEGMVSTIGSATTHKDVLENPNHISKNILARGLDAGTAYEILSIDIADVNVGENIGAKLQIDQANADKQIAQAKAEERRAMAVALEQEMRARVVEAEAEVPRAMAAAFLQGNLGIMDYYRMKNIQADSSMREAIAAPENGGPTGLRQ